MGNIVRVSLHLNKDVIEDKIILDMLSKKTKRSSYAKELLYNIAVNNQINNVVNTVINNEDSKEDYKELYSLEL